MPVITKLKTTGIDWDHVISSLNGETWEPDFLEPDQYEVRYYFLGTVFTIMPSGKFYTPWANSNVTPCPYCHGSGCRQCGDMGSLEAYHDSLFMEALESECAAHGVLWGSGEGDPCDIFISECREISMED